MTLELLQLIAEHGGEVYGHSIKLDYVHDQGIDHKRGWSLSIDGITRSTYEETPEEAILKGVGNYLFKVKSHEPN